MTLEEDVRNMKGRIREAIYEGKHISFFVNFHAFYMRHTGAVCSSTYNFLSYKSVSRFYVYFRPNMPLLTREQLLYELKNYIQDNGGRFDVI